MISFLRKIRSNLLSENKIGKYLLYAVGEILLVVIGILIALKINNINQNNHKQAEETRLLTNLNRDLHNDVLILNKITAHTEFRMKQIDSIFTILTNPNRSQLHLFIKLNENLTNEDLFYANSGTYDEGLSSGKINFIENNELRERIFTYYRVVDRGGTDKVVDDLMDDVIIPQLSEIMLPHKEIIEFIGFKNSMPPLTIKSFAHHKKYNTLLAQKYVAHKNQIFYWSEIIEDASTLKTQIETELKK